MRTDPVGIVECSTLWDVSPSGLGFDFPSIVNVNARIAVSDILRALNHRLSPVRDMARITLAKWESQENNCMPPLEVSTRRRSISILGSWRPAAEILRITSMKIVDTDQPEWSEFASIQHFFNRACHHRPDLNLTDAARHPFEKDGFQHLHLPQYVQAIRDKYRNDRTMAKYHMLDQVKYISKITIGHDFVTYDPSSFVPVARQRVLTLLIIRNALHDTQ